MIAQLYRFCTTSETDESHGKIATLLKPNTLIKVFKVCQCMCCFVYRIKTKTNQQIPKLADLFFFFCLFVCNFVLSVILFCFVLFYLSQVEESDQAARFISTRSHSNQV